MNEPNPKTTPNRQALARDEQIIVLTSRRTGLNLTLHMRSPFTLLFALRDLSLATLLLAFSLPLALADPIQIDRHTIGKEVHVADDGSTLTVTLHKKDNGEFQTHVAVPEPYSSGWHKLTAEYKTTGFSALGIFRINIASPEISMPPWQGVPAATDWAPVEVYFHLKSEGKISILFILDADVQGVTDGAEITIRNIKIDSYKTPVNTELLGNADFSTGTIGDIPPLWTWGFRAESGDYRIVEDSSFNSAKQVVQIKGGKEPNTLVGFNHPLEKTGTVELSVWAKSDSGAGMVIFVIGNGYKWIESKSFPLTPTWTKYSLTKACPGDIEIGMFTPRIDVFGKGKNRADATALIGACSVIYKDN